MNLKLEFEFSKAPILKEVDALKKQIDDMRPLPADVEGRVMQKLRLDWNYNSNAIEGNKLSYGETVAFLMEGITAKGKPLKDHLDIRGHNEAINFLLEIVKDSRPISEADIRALHKMILVEPYDSPAKTAEGLSTTKRITLGEYKTSANHVKTATGEIHYYATPQETPAKMEELMDWLEEVERYIHPVVIAALFHHKFVAIHPFDDGNGRMSRMLMNLILLRNELPPVVVRIDDRKNYYSLLSRADVGDSWPFVEYIAELQLNSLRLYLKAANGGDVNEEEDVDKEIALFRMELKNKVEPQKKAVKEIIYSTIQGVILPLFNKISKKLSPFDEFFERIKLSVDISTINNSIKQLRTPDDPMYNLYENIQELIKSNTKIETIMLNIDLINFKNPENIFDVVEYLDINFEDKFYTIGTMDLDEDIRKPYDEKLTALEESEIIKHIIKNIRSQVQDNFKN